jgi:hypothetical protein
MWIAGKQLYTAGKYIVTATSWPGEVVAGKYIVSTIP